MEINIIYCSFTKYLLCLYYVPGIFLNYAITYALVYIATHQVGPFKILVQNEQNQELLAIIHVVEEL